MSLNSELGYLIGKKIVHIITVEHMSMTHSQMFLIFDDDSSIEIFGYDFHNSNWIIDKGFDDTIKYSRLTGGKIGIYPYQE